MERLPFKINGTDFSDCINHKAYTVTYEKRLGNNGGMMLDGSVVEDLIASKAVVKVEATALPSDRMAQLVAACLGGYVSLTYFDPMRNAQRAATFIPSVSDIGVLTNSPNVGLWLKQGTAVTLKER